MFSLIRLIILLVIRSRFRRWFFLIVGVILAIVGIFFGATSHQVSYSKIDRATLIHYLYFPGNDDDSAYLQLSDGSMYVIHQNDFTPQLNSDQIRGNTLSLVYEPTDTTSIDKQTENGQTHLVGDGANVVQLVLYDRNGQNARTFTASEYAENPQGFYRNNWPVGIVLMLSGLLISALALLLPMFLARRRANKNYAPGYNQQVGTPQSVPSPYNPAPQNPYQQPYQGPDSYQPYQNQPAQAPRAKDPQNQPYYQAPQD